MEALHLQAPSPFACAISKHRGDKEREMQMEETVQADSQPQKLLSLVLCISFSLASAHLEINLCSNACGT